MSTLLELAERCPGPLVLAEHRDDSLEVVLAAHGVHPSDRRVFASLAVLLGSRGSGSVRVSDLCVMAVPMLAEDPEDCFLHMFRCHDSLGTSLVDRAGLEEALRLLNLSFSACGDESFSDTQVDVLVSSLYTSVGKVDGPVPYAIFVQALAKHSLVELFVSQRFQGSWREKTSLVETA